MPDVLGVGGEGELGVLALAPQPGEVNLQQTPGLQVGVAAVLTGLAVLHLTDHVVGMGNEVRGSGSLLLRR